METATALYRKLSMLSQMKFGRFEFETVRNLIALGQIDYLRWVYYNMSNIDFLPEVKEAIGIEKEIEKPGTDKKYWEEYKKLQREAFKKVKLFNKEWDDMTEEEKLECYKHSAVKKRNQRIKRERAESKQRYLESKRELRPSQLQAINHGHGCGKKRSMDKIYE